MLLVPGVVTLAVMLWGITGASFWKDEGATLVATGRSLPELVRMLGHLDVVHGLYYMLMWSISQTVGRTEFDFRLPSAIGMAIAALGIAAIGRRSGSVRTGVLAGLVFAALPVISHWGQNARPYALVTMTAVLASLQLLRVIESPTRGRLAAYAGLVALLGYFNLFGLLLISAHAVTVAGASWGGGAAGDSAGWGNTERGWRLFPRWLAAAVTGAVAVTPIVVIGWRERRQISWIPAPTVESVHSLLITLGGGTVLSMLVIAGLAVLGAARADRPGKRLPDSQLTWLCLPWLVMPPAILMSASFVVHAYNYTYVLYCAVPVALLAGAGLSALWMPWRLAALGIIIILVYPGQLIARSPDGHGDNIRGAAQFLAQHAHAGDAVVYPYGDAVPGWPLAYPYGFTKLRNISELTPPALSGTEHGLPVSPAVFARRLASVHRLWVVEMSKDIQPPAKLVGKFRYEGTWRFSDIWVRFYQRPAS